MIKTQTASVTCIAAAVLTGVAALVPYARASDQNGVQNAWSRLPVTFVENRGQTDSQVRYFARGSHYAFFFTPREVVLSLVDTRQTVEPTRGAHEAVSSRYRPGLVAPVRLASTTSEEQTYQQTVLGLQFLGSNPRVTVSGSERAPGNINYIHGADASQWQTDVPTYREVVYHELWPGIELRVREHGGALKYEFHVRPGAKVEEIRLAYQGADRLSLDRAGNLMIDTALGTIRDSAPTSFQEIDGDRVPIESSYALDSRTTSGYGFKVGRYKADQELVIDPGIEYSTYLGGSGDDVPSGVAVDAAGNAYVVGYTQSPDFPVTAGAFRRTGSLNNSLDAFVAKINPSGTAFVYATFLGGSNFDWGRAIAIDAAGNAYIAGQTQSADFPVTGKAFQKSLAHLNCPRCGIDVYDAFVAKLNATGSSLLYSTFLGGATGIDDALAIAIDASGNAYVAGETSSTDFPTTSGAFRRTISGGDDAYVAKLNPSGSALAYSTYIGGTLTDSPARIALDTANNAIVFGQTSSPDFPTTPGAFATVANGQFDSFLLKLNASGSNLVSSALLGGSAQDSAGGLAIDQAGDIYVSGTTSSTDFPTTPGTFQPICTGSDAYVAKLTPDISTLLHSTCISKTGAKGIAVSPTGNVWITGQSSGGFTATPDAFQQFPAVGPAGLLSNAVIAELNDTGSAVLYGTYIGGTRGDFGRDLALDSAGNVYVVGRTASPDFPTTPNAVDRVFRGDPTVFWGDGFVAKLALDGTQPPPPPTAAIASLTISGSNFVGGNSFNVNVALSTAARDSGAVISLATSSPAAALPATITIPAGAQTGTVVAATSVVPTATAVTITASLGNTSMSTNVTLQPAPPPGTLSSLSLVPNVVTGGNVATGIIGLTNPAGPGGYTVALSTNDAIASVPSSVTVPAGETTASFPVSTAAVVQKTGMTIFATAGTATALAPLTVNPSAPPVTASALTVTATGRSGERVASSPTGINAAVGTSSQASFTSGTIITLSVSNGRDAIWSGACSSGGSKAKACTFALNSDAAVTANVQ